MFPFDVVTGDAVHRIIHGNIPACVEVVKSAYLAHDRGDAINPKSSFLRFPKAPSRRIISLPAFLDGDTPVAGIKWIASWPENIERGIPRASAVLILNDDATGYPYACIEASIISAARTAASAALAARLIDRDCIRLGLIGNGLIARYVYQFLLGVGYAFNEVWLYDKNPREAQRFAREVCRPEAHAEVRSAATADEVLTRCDLLVFATVAPSPWVHDVRHFAHAPTILGLSLRDLAPEVILGAQNVVDDAEHAMSANTSVHLTEQQTGNRAFVSGTLADLLEGRVRLDPTRTTVLSPFGMGILDLAVGRWVYEQSVAGGDAHRFHNFFHETSR